MQVFSGEMQYVQLNMKRNFTYNTFKFNICLVSTNSLHRERSNLAWSLCQLTNLQVNYATKTGIVQLECLGANYELLINGSPAGLLNSLWNGDKQTLSLFEPAIAVIA